MTLPYLVQRSFDERGNTWVLVTDVIGYLLGEADDWETTTGLQAAVRAGAAKSLREAAARLSEAIDVDPHPPD